MLRNFLKCNAFNLAWFQPSCVINAFLEIGHLIPFSQIIVNIYIKANALIIIKVHYPNISVAKMCNSQFILFTFLSEIISFNCLCLFL